MHGDLRDDVPLAGALDGERLDDGQRQRDGQPPDGADPDRRVDLDGAADALDVGLHHVHADAAAGHVGHRRGGREAGPEDQREDIAAVHARQGVPGHDAALDRHPRDLVRVYAGAVVGDLDDDVSTLVVGAEGQHALRRLAEPQPLLGLLHAVVDGVADEVGERVLDRLEKAAVELGLPADHGQPDLLAAGRGQVPHDPGQLGPQVIDRLHTGLHHRFLQFGGDEVEPLAGTQHRLVGDRADRPDQLVAGEHELADQPHERVQQVHVDADRRVGDRAAGTRRRRRRRPGSAPRPRPGRPPAPEAPPARVRPRLPPAPAGRPAATRPPVPSRLPSDRPARPRRWPARRPWPGQPAQRTQPTPPTPCRR